MNEEQFCELFKPDGMYKIAMPFPVDPHSFWASPATGHVALFVNSGMSGGGISVNEQVLQDFLSWPDKPLGSKFIIARNDGSGLRYQNYASLLPKRAVRQGANGPYRTYDAHHLADIDPMAPPTNRAVATLPKPTSGNGMAEISAAELAQIVERGGVWSMDTRAWQTFCQAKRMPFMIDAEGKFWVGTAFAEKAKEKAPF